MSAHGVKKVSGILQQGEGAATAASHTYDKGYKKWEAFDVDAALEEEVWMECEVSLSFDRYELCWAFSSCSKFENHFYRQKGERERPRVEELIDSDDLCDRRDVDVEESKAATLTPASIVKQCTTTPAVAKLVPRALGVAQSGDVESLEREKGNEAFKRGEFQAAIKSYTKCIGKDLMPVLNTSCTTQ